MNDQDTRDRIKESLWYTGIGATMQYGSLLGGVASLLYEPRNMPFFLMCLGGYVIGELLRANGNSIRDSLAASAVVDKLLDERAKESTLAQKAKNPESTDDVEGYN